MFSLNIFNGRLALFQKFYRCILNVIESGKAEENDIHIANIFYESLLEISRCFRYPSKFSSLITKQSNFQKMEILL